MSAASQSTTIRFFGILKNWFSRPDPAGNGTPGTETELTQEPAPASPPPHSSSPAPVPPGRTNVPKNQDQKNAGMVVIPLQTIIMSMSRELRTKVRSAVSQDLSISVPIEKILPQLGKGSVKLPFGDIRRTAPHVFAPGTEYDNLPVILPLSEILPRINPSSLTRRPGQKQIDQLSDDIASPFAAGGRGLTISTETPKPPSTQFTRRVPQTAPLAPRAITPTPPAAKTQRISFNPAPTPPPAAAPAPAPLAAAPVSEVKSMALRIAPSAPPRVVANPQTVASESVPLRQAVPTPVPPSGPELVVTLSALAESWPETMRHEIVKLSLTSSRVALPSNLVEEGLKRGRVTFPWKTLHSWIRPAMPHAPSVHDEIELELPLKVLAPMFLSLKKSATKSQTAATVDEAIPNLFFGFPQTEPTPVADAPEASPAFAPRSITPEAAPVEPTVEEFAFTSVAQPAVPAPVVPAAAPVVKPAHVPRAPDTNYYVWDDNADTAFVDETEFKRKPTPSLSSHGTDFMVRYATPNEIVSRAAALDGVAGALIALPDGLAVANKIPEDLNGDTLAAFLPQLFSKMSQCTKELRMGELNNLNFTVGNIPWKIFRVNAVFFAAFGYVGQGLPTSQLAALAAELDRKNQR